jgi:hypothetical protein
MEVKMLSKHHYQQIMETLPARVKEAEIQWLQTANYSGFKCYCQATAKLLNHREAYEELKLALEFVSTQLRMEEQK